MLHTVLVRGSRLQASVRVFCACDNLLTEQAMDGLSRGGAATQ